MAAPKSNTTTWKMVRNRLNAVHDMSVQVGVLKEFGGGALHDRLNGSTSKETLASLAFVHEFGSADGHTPERSFLRSSLEMLFRGELQRMTSEAVVRLLSNKNVTPSTVFDKIGKWAVGKVKMSIEKQLIPQALAYSTIAEKVRVRGMSPPTTALVASEKLLKAINYRVTGKQRGPK